MGLPKVQMALRLSLVGFKHSFTKWSTDSFTATVKHSPVDPAILFLDGP